MEKELEKIKSVAEQKFIAIAAEAKELALRCLSIKIDSPAMLQQATQLASEANKLVNVADAKRLEINKPAQDSIKIVNALVNTNIIDPLEKGIKFYKEKVSEWNKKEKEREQKEKNANQLKFTYLKEIEKTLQEKVQQCDTAEKCDKLIVNINNQFPAAEVFIPYAKEAMNVKATFIKVLTETKWAISTNTYVKEETLVKVEELAQEIEVRNEIVESNSVAVKSSVRKVWKWEIIDEREIPRLLLCPNDKAIREYMNVNKSEFGKEKIINGIRFFEDESVIIK